MSSYAIDSESDQIVVVTLTGEVRFDTVTALLDELEDLGSSRRELAVLVDETEASPGLLGAPEIRRMVDHWRRATILRRGRIAVVAPGLAMYGVNRMAQSFGGEDAEGHIGVFKVREAATEWLLEVDAPTLH
jgi:hypothetical protein